MTIDAGTQAAIANGTMGVGYGLESNPLGDGVDDFVVALQGYAGAGTSIKLTFTNGTSNGIGSTIQGTFKLGDIHRAICQVYTSAGPNGHLYGHTGTSLTLTDQSQPTTPYIAPGLNGIEATPTYYIWNAVGGGGSLDYVDPMLDLGMAGVYSTSLGNMLKLTELTPPASFGGTPASQILTLTIGYTSGDPVSATIRIRNCRVQQTTF